MSQFSDVNSSDIAKVIFEGLIVHDGNVITDANARAAQMFGFESPAQMKGLPYQELLSPTGQSATAGRVKARREGPYVAYCRHQDGSEFLMDVNAIETEVASVRRRLVAFRHTDDLIGLNGDECGDRVAILDRTVKALANTIEKRDSFTAGHQSRVSQIGEGIARKLQASEAVISIIRSAGNIHDIGKINVPSDILMKPDALTDNEYNLVKEHPQTGYSIVSGIDFSGPVPEAIVQHHERLDGTGYPTGTNDPIFEARVLAVADVYDALTSARHYRAPMSAEDALNFIDRHEDGRLDPSAVAALQESVLHG